MMRVRTLGLCVLVAFSTAVVLAGNASAQAPEYGRCLKAPKVSGKYTGKYDNAKCIPAKTETEKKAVEKGEGKFEWYPGAVKNKQTSTGGIGVLEEVGKNEVECESESSTGEYASPKEGKNIVVKFKGCHAPPFTCTSAGHEKGELETRPLAGRLVWEDEKTQKTAIDLFPESGELFIEFNCEGKLTVAVEGSVLVPVKADAMAETFTLAFKAKNGFQVPEYYEENTKKVKDVLLSDFAGKGFAQAGQTITSTVKNEEKLEVNTTV